MASRRILSDAIADTLERLILSEMRVILLDGDPVLQARFVDGRGRVLLAKGQRITDDELYAVPVCYWPSLAASFLRQEEEEDKLEAMTRLYAAWAKVRRLAKRATEALPPSAYWKGWP